MSSQQLVNFGGIQSMTGKQWTRRHQWWIERLRESFKIYDIVRIDHFRGFESTGKSQLVPKLPHLVNGSKVLATNSLQP